MALTTWLSGVGQRLQPGEQPGGELRSSMGILLWEALARRTGWSKGAARIALEAGRKGRSQTTFGWPWCWCGPPEHPYPCVSPSPRKLAAA